jgi:hypothetical protein
MPKAIEPVPEAVRTIMPWVVATAACLLASVILSSFIDTLHLSIQRGEAMRKALALQDASRGGANLHRP